MKFQRIKGFKGLVYVPEQTSFIRQKHPCSDCFSCQHCDDERCEKCLMRSRARDLSPRPVEDDWS